MNFMSFSFSNRKNRVFSALFGLVLVAPVVSDISYLSRARADTESKDQPAIISVSATGTYAVVPDMAVLNLNVVQTAKTAHEALSANSASMEKILSALKNQGVADKDLQTSNFNISPRYNHPARRADGSQPQPEIIGYTVRNGLVVQVRQLDRLGEILDQTVALGVNSGGGIRFTSSNPDAALEQARKNAVTNAIAKATTLSNTAGVTLGRITAIEEQSFRAPRPQFMEKMVRADASPAQVPVAAGEKSWSVSITMRWELVQ